MREIYIITVGDYSDYGIVAVFDSRDLAEKYVETFEGHYKLTIEEYILNPFKSGLELGKNPYRVSLDKQGNISETIPVNYSWDVDNEVGDRFTETFNKRYMVYHCLAQNSKEAEVCAKEKLKKELKNTPK